jgi:hypothetical protein
MRLEKSGEIRSRRLISTEENGISPIRCDRCEAVAEAVINVGDSNPFWICPLCYEETHS